MKTGFRGKKLTSIDGLLLSLLFPFLRQAREVLMRPWRPTLTRIRVGMVLTILAAGLFTPSSARAGCGDYVTMEPHSPSQNPPEATPEQPSSPTTSTPVKFVIPCPCRPNAPIDPGPLPCPGCSAPAAPQSATTPSPGLHLDDWGIPVGCHLLGSANQVASLADSGPGKAIHQGCGIFHPPRFSLSHQVT